MCWLRKLWSAYPASNDEQAAPALRNAEVGRIDLVPFAAIPQFRQTIDKRIEVRTPTRTEHAGHVLKRDVSRSHCSDQSQVLDVQGVASAVTGGSFRRFAKEGEALARWATE